MALFGQGMLSRMEETCGELQDQVEGGQKLVYSLSALGNPPYTLCTQNRICSSKSGHIFVVNGFVQKVNPVDLAASAAGWRPLDQGYTVDRESGRGEGAGPAALKFFNMYRDVQSGTAQAIVVNQTHPEPLVLLA